MDVILARRQQLAFAKCKTLGHYEKLCPKKQVKAIQIWKPKESSVVMTTNSDLGVIVEKLDRVELVQASPRKARVASTGVANFANATKTKKKNQME
ncbi:hypothetical protein Gorai_012014, partial [Gossypium raimondii]|nr:hypothetical protein [Gossypium raimondii]